MSSQVDLNATADAEPIDASAKQVEISQLLRDGLWQSNPGIVQLLGLCPLLAVSNSVVNALGLGIATLMTLIISNTIVSACRKGLRDEIRIPVFVLLIASAVTAIELLINAWLHELYLSLGIFIPLIVTNCMILARAETFACKNSVPLACIDAIAHGLGFLLVLVVLGGFRELLGYGTLFRDAHLLFGDQAQSWVLPLWHTDSALLIALLPPGAFLSLGLLLAIKNLLDFD